MEGPSSYSEANSQEWFAENFSLYEMGKLDKLDPRFIDFMKEVVND